MSKLLETTWTKQAGRTVKSQKATLSLSRNMSLLTIAQPNLKKNNSAKQRVRTLLEQERPSDFMLNLYNKKRLDERQVTELVGISRGLLADGKLDDGEIEYLHKWLISQAELTENPLINILYARIRDTLADGVVDEDERRDLLDTLVEFTGSDFEIGEDVKSTSLPLDRPTPQISFEGSHFTFTGTFVSMKRRECEAAVLERGATAGSLTKKTRFLVIGSYATQSWIQSSYGRKIEKACQLKAKGAPIALVSEDDWLKALG